MILGALGILSQYGILTIIKMDNFVLVMLGFLILVVGTLFKGI